jgi:hypothetical protein
MKLAVFLILCAGSVGIIQALPRTPKMGREMVDFINGDDSIPFMVSCC